MSLFISNAYAQSAPGGAQGGSQDGNRIARGRERELNIMENYLLELIEKTKLQTAEIVNMW